MHALNWNDLRYLLAVARTGSYAAAGRQLGLDPTTVARRVRALEDSLRVRLFARGTEGALRPTEAGETAVRRAEAVEAEIGGLTSTVQGADAVARGTVRLTAVPLLINRLLVPALPALVERHPGVRLELVAEPRDLNLTRREADMALRLARPTPDAGRRILARRLATLPYAAYVACGSEKHAAELPWLTYDDGMAHLPQARWLARAAARDGGPGAVAANDGEALLQAVAAGLGRSLLPCAVGDRVDNLRRLPPGEEAWPERELWLLTHPDLKPLARIAAVTEWLEALLAMPTARLGSPKVRKILKK